MHHPEGTTTPLAALMGSHRVLGLLPPATREALAPSLTVLSAANGERLADEQQLATDLYWLIEGECALLDADGEPVLALRANDLFGANHAGAAGVHAALAKGQVSFARFDAATLQAWCEGSPGMAYLLGNGATANSAQTVRLSGSDPALNLMTTPVRALIRRAPITLSPQTSIREAARIMSEQRVSSVLIVEQDLLFGLITDRDLRNRVIAAGLDTARPIADIATLAPMSVDVRAPAFDALLLMARHAIHHVPVLDGQQIAGMITATDLTEQHSTSAVYLAGDIYKQSTVEGLQAAAGKIGRLQLSLAAAQASADNTGRIITTITDAITTRLLQLGEAKLGPPPVDYVWVAAGSQARSEQTAKSDQDNCMVLDDAYDEATHGEYFKSLATFVCDGLNACGYVYCPGEMMAMTDQWRQPRRRWIEYFTEWTSQPDPTALMLTCVFFDMRAIHGNGELLSAVRRHVLQRTRGNTIFLAHLVGNALLREPPLGMFKGIATVRSGEHKGTVDLKHHGVVPVVDMARVYALAGGNEDVNTQDRLRAANASGSLNEKNARDLQDALEFLAFLRLQHQTRQMNAGISPDNHLRPEELSNFEQTQLKDAFVVVQSMQKALGHRYQAGRF
ncbi:putative nucleotidyltransferase substrate binding domain-containing protein [Hydrogenophaga sp. RWCD_12]|uniref:putative nucleotidyltransferase substrate binding domain-containing protein n=1 Tax=Hydrogenophaga sp. RWCD_12 TaxID=3391190 RepID=UPI0039848284